MAERSLVSPEDQTVTFVELFFDLVFVFSVTQVVGLLHDGITWASVGQAVLVFWLVWWAWSQFTWSLNAADTTHPRIEFVTLLATAIAFFMAVTLPGAFQQGGALLFAIPYVLVKAGGLVIYIQVSSTVPERQAAVRVFSLFSLAGLITVLVGAYLGGIMQPILWAASIVMDFIAARIGGQQEGWGLHTAHFAERHGLFVIIALGESLIVAASGATRAELSLDLMLVGVMAVAVVCGLWWSYFDEAKEQLERVFETLADVPRAEFGRDVYSLLHFPMLMGVIANAVAIEAIVAHPDEPLALSVRIAMAAGLFLFVGGMGIALWLAEKKMPRMRLLAIIVTAVAVIALNGVPPAVTLGVALVGLVTVAVAERNEQSPQTGKSPG